MVSVRPEHLAFAAEGAGAEAVVLAREFRGHAVTYTLALGQQEVQLHDTGQALHAEGQRVWVCAVRAGRVVR
ncbi:TOBE domain-containing protein [Deinococcus radiopugnans]